MLEDKKKRENKTWEKEVKEIKSERQVWEGMSRKRVKRWWINEGIDMEKWNRYFRDLLGNAYRKVVSGD